MVNKFQDHYVIHKLIEIRDLISTMTHSKQHDIYVSKMLVYEDDKPTSVGRFESSRTQNEK